MDDMPPSPALPPEEKRKRGRPRQMTAETPRQLVDRLRAELKDAEIKLRENEDKRAAISGHAVIRHARQNVEFARQLAAALRVEVKGDTDRGLVADLMQETSAEKSA